MALTIYGIISLTPMMAMYALERHGSMFVLAFAIGCGVSSTYGFLSGALAFRGRRSDLDDHRRPPILGHHKREGDLVTRPLRELQTRHGGHDLLLERRTIGGLATRPSQQALRVPQR